jgi:hypothetical protein
VEQRRRLQDDGKSRPTLIQANRRTLGLSSDPNTRKDEILPRPINTQFNLLLNGKNQAGKKQLTREPKVQLTGEAAAESKTHSKNKLGTRRAMGNTQLIWTGIRECRVKNTEWRLCSRPENPCFGKGELQSVGHAPG